ncbi:MAG: diguanylate cyclase [Microthrixaceae bacterium]
MPAHTVDPSNEARAYVRAGTLCAWTAVVVAGIILAVGWGTGVEVAKGRLLEDWPSTAPWSAVLFALLALGSLLGRRNLRAATWLFTAILVLDAAMAVFRIAQADLPWNPIAGPDNDTGLTLGGVPSTAALVVIAMIASGALLLLAGRAPATRTTLLTSAALVGTATIFVNTSGLDAGGFADGFGVLSGVLTVLTLTAVGAINPSVAPAILSRTRPLHTVVRLGLGVTVAIPVIGYVDAGYSVVRPQALAILSALILVSAIAAAVSWFGWADFEAQAWRQIAENATDAVLEIDAHGIIRRATGDCLQVTGWGPHELVGRHAEDLIEPSNHEHHRELMATYLANPTARAMGSGALPVVGPDGSTRLVILRLVPVMGPEGLIVCATLIDASRESELRHQATHDPLTEILNRAGFTDVLRRELASGRDCGVLFLDLDNLKVINDELSHAAGDKALHAVAQAIESQLRGRDRVGRIGGDEFACVITDLGDMAEFHGVAGRVAQSIREIVIGGTGWTTSVSASIGGVLAPGHTEADAALAAADECMYAVKGSGRNGVFIAGKYPYDDDGNPSVTEDRRRRPEQPAGSDSITRK